MVTRLSETSHGQAGGGENNDNEYFVIRNFGTNQSPDVTQIKFTGINNIPANTPLTDLELYKRSDNDFGDTWGTSLGTATAIALNEVTFGDGSATLFTGFSQFIANNKGTTASLPVEMIRFDAHAVNNEAVELIWTTAFEENNTGFYIQRSKDAAWWNDLGFVASQGNTTTTRTYTYTDHHLWEGIHYYRLKQVDEDGGFEYSQIRSVKLLGDDKVVVYPNPTNDVIFVDSKADINKVSVYGIDGQLKQMIKNTNAIDLSILPNGLYHLQVETTTGYNSWHRIVKEQ